MMVVLQFATYLKGSAWILLSQSLYEDVDKWHSDSFCCACGNVLLLFGVFLLLGLGITDISH